jgi:probable addiction module antidote protein
MTSDARKTSLALSENTMSRSETFRRFDAAEHLRTEADMAAYLEACLEEGDPKLIAAALGDIARARGMSQIARDAGIGRESLYRALSAEGNPEFATIMKVVRALGFKLSVMSTSDTLDTLDKHAA